MNKPTLAEIRLMANGRWYGILSSIGISESLLNTRIHRSCPSCGGRDRYRYTDWQGDGGFICNQCKPQGGSGFDLVMLVYGCDFSEAVGMVEASLGFGESSHHAPMAVTPITKPVQQPDKAQRLQEHLKQCKPITELSPVGQYLINRGLDWGVIKGIDNLFYHPSLHYWACGVNKPHKMGKYPAMIARIELNGELMGIHVTYLEKPQHCSNSGYWQKIKRLHPETGELLPAKKMQTRRHGALRGAAIQLYPMVNGDIAVCEGIETALAVKQMFGLPVWACATAGGVRNVELPANTKRLFIIADNDESNTGQEATRDLANRAIQLGIEVKQWTPPTVGHDALDELNQQ